MRDNERELYLTASFFSWMFARKKGEKCMRKTKMTALLLAGMMVMGSLSGCGKNEKPEVSTPEPSTSTSMETTNEEQPTEKKHIQKLTIGTSGANDRFSIMSQGGAFGKLNYNCVANAYLTYIDNDKKIQPYFLKSYEISSDGKQLKIEFPLDKVWHDGKKVTAEDVKFTLEYTRDVLADSYVKNLVNIEDTGEGNMTLTFSEKDAYQFLANGGNTISVIPKHIWENVPEPKDYTGEDASVGCGPYKLTSIDKDAGLSVYEAVPENNYLGEIMVDSITLKSYSTQEALLMAMKNGEIDMMYDYATPIDTTLMGLVEGDGDIDKGESDYAGHYQITFGMEEGRPYTDRALREATIKALQWDLVTHTVNGEFGQIPGSGVIAPSCKGYDGSLWKLYYDAEEAKKILDQAGYADKDGDGLREKPDGSKLSIKVTPQFSSKKQETMHRIADIMMASLKNVGIHSYIDEESMQNAEIWEKNMVDGNYDMNIGYCTSGIAQYRSAFRYFVADLPSDEKENTAGTTWIWGTDHDPRLTEGVWGLVFASSEEEYIQHIRALQKLVSEELFAFALCWEKAFYPYRIDKYTGFDNWDGIGAVNPETWYDLSAK